MKKVFLFGGLLAAALCLSVTASAQGWYDDFDSYTPGPLTGQGGWELWAGGNDATVVTTLSHTPSQSIQMYPLVDTVHRFATYAGRSTFKAWAYIPTAYTGQGYFIMNDTYQPPTYEWCVQCWFGANDDNFHGNAGSGNDTIAGPFTRDTWGEIQVFYYFDDDWMMITYDGHVLDDVSVADHPTLGPGYTISGGVFGGGAQQVGLEAVDLFSDTGTEYYYDTLSFDTMMPWMDIKCNGGDAGVVVPSGTPVSLDFSLVAGIGEGFAVDVWLVIKRGAQLYSYDGMGSLYGWNSGTSNAYATGPLANAFGNCLDAGIPPGSYQAYIAIDTNPNGTLDMGSIYAYDMVDFTAQ
jgi:hypothetical protein